MRHHWVTIGTNQRQCSNCDAEQHREEDGRWTYDDMNLAFGNHRCKSNNGRKNE